MLECFGVIGLILRLKTRDAANLAWADTGKQVSAIVLWTLGIVLFPVALAIGAPITDKQSLVTEFYLFVKQ